MVCCYLALFHAGPQSGWQPRCGIYGRGTNALHRSIWSESGKCLARNVGNTTRYESIWKKRLLVENKCFSVNWLRYNCVALRVISTFTTFNTPPVRCTSQIAEYIKVQWLSRIRRRHKLQLDATEDAEIAVRNTHNKNIFFCPWLY